MQEKGLDTVDANRALGLPDDCREYTSVRNMLADLGIKSVKLMVSLPRMSGSAQLCQLNVTAFVIMQCCLLLGQTQMISAAIEMPSQCRNPARASS